MMHYTLFGESHGPAVGVLLTDVPPGLPVDEAFIREQLLRRMGQGGLTTARQEKEEVHFLSGGHAVTGTVVVQAQNPGLNPQLLEKAIAAHLPVLTPDFTRIRRRELLDASGNIFR